MNVHLFGVASSPGCANYCLKQAANDNKEEFGSEPANFIINDFYVDDDLKSVPTETEAIDIIAKSHNLCAKRGLRLHKIVSNSKKVMEMIAPENRAKGLKDLNFLQDSLPVARALGVQWCVESDCVSSSAYTRISVRFFLMRYPHGHYHGVVMLSQST